MTTFLVSLKKIFFFVICAGVASAAFGQTKDSVYLSVDQPAQYPGGYAELLNHVQKNFKYQKKAPAAGTVFVSFVVEKDGTITNVKIQKGLCQPCDEEALRLITIMPAWEPGQYKGQPVRSTFMLPVKFKK